MNLEGIEVYKPEYSVTKYYGNRQLSIVRNEKAVLLDSTLTPFF